MFSDLLKVEVHLHHLPHHREVDQMTRPTQIHWVAYPQVLQVDVLPQSLLTSLQAKRLEIRPWRQGGSRVVSQAHSVPVLGLAREDQGRLRVEGQPRT